MEADVHENSPCLLASNSFSPVNSLNRDAEQVTTVVNQSDSLRKVFCYSVLVPSDVTGILKY
ncbi:hypothetical protein JZ751_027964 [Albula glossodonta]|uniref:Uncharacterized protein n=1 Tax=Albula glossodonta TaxID=121402 RepID=A0A8T2PBB3_9TELE|nr:hypothetical protein JZ751_027964 [Albula glossodonta]